MNVNKFASPAIVGALIFFASLGASDVAGVGHEQPSGLHLISLTYEDGMFTQSLEVIDGEIIDATWTAQITRDGQPICAGGAPGVYESGSVSVFTIDEWVGDECPDLIEGDVALAVWRWKNRDGTISREFGDVEIN